jgi:hypothetical protein
MTADVKAIDQTRDPITSVLLPMLQAAVNADLSAYFAASGIGDTEAVRTTQCFPISAQVTASVEETPVLACFRSRNRRQYTTLRHLDHYATLTFQYLSPACSFSDLGARWPVLSRVWMSIVDTLRDGSHPAWENGAPALENCGLVRVDEDTADEQEIFGRDGDYAYPMFSATIAVVWRDTSNWRFGSSAVKFRSLTANLYTESNPETGIDPDVAVLVEAPAEDALTEAANVV